MVGCSQSGGDPFGAIEFDPVSLTIIKTEGVTGVPLAFCHGEGGGGIDSPRKENNGIFSRRRMAFHAVSGFFRCLFPIFL